MQRPWVQSPVLHTQTHNHSRGQVEQPLNSHGSTPWQGKQHFGSHPNCPPPPLAQAYPDFSTESPTFPKPLSPWQVRTASWLLYLPQLLIPAALPLQPAQKQPCQAQGSRPRPTLFHNAAEGQGDSGPATAGQVSGAPAFWDLGSEARLCLSSPEAGRCGT